ncbi:MAG: hypothetical protein ACOC8A_02040 [bacterium]
MGIWQWARRHFRRRADRYNLRVEPHFAIKASARKPYFRELEAAARRAGVLGSFVVDEEGRLRPGTRSGLPTLRARLSLDVYPNPAALEGRTVFDFDHPDRPRRPPRLSLRLEDETELFLSRTEGELRVAGAVPRSG